MKKQEKAPNVLMTSNLKISASLAKHTVHMDKNMELNVREQASIQFQ